MDLLSRAIDELGLRSAAFLRFHLATVPWGLAYGAGVQGMHVVERGQCVLRVGVTSTPLDAGDLVIVPGGAAHELHSPGRRPSPTDAQSLQAQHRGEGPVMLGPVKTTPTCELVCGALEFEAKDHPMLGSLPPVIHVRRAQLRDATRLGVWVDALIDEVTKKTAGSDALVARLSELILIEALRLQGQHEGECPSGGWFRGLRDPSLARALSAFHQAISEPWTVEALASQAGQSRSVFAARFSSVMGEAPLAYVTRWRMFHARRLLRTTRDSLAEVAAQVGYGSAAALSLAFSRAHPMTPGEYRHHHTS